MAAFAARYARAFADVVTDSHLAPKDVKQQLADFMAAWHESPDLREVFSDPSFPLEKQVSILDALNRTLQMAPQVRNFIAVLLQHGRIGSIEEILTEFRHEMNRRLGISEVEITSARALGEDERRELVARIGAVAPGQIEPKFVEDTTLIGGVVVRVGSTIYDGSVRGRLDRLQRELAAAE